MASGPFFYSSPPRLTLDLWNHSASTFFTPQQPSKPKWTSAFAPASPSPLRTSRNENLMSSPLSGGGDASEKVESESENTTAATLRQNADANHTTPFSTVLSTTDQSTSTTTTPSFSFQNPFALATISATTTTTSSEDPTTTTARTRATQFQFSARARSSNPSAVLQSHAREGRDSRKRLFLDRLRSRRDEARSERTGDNVLRMDYMRERREWEVGQLAMMTEGPVDVDDELLMMMMEVQDQQGAGGEDVSPVEDWGYNDDVDVQELASGYYGLQQDLGASGHGGGGGAVGPGFEEFSDDGYDEVFMEVLSQGQTDNPSASGVGFALPSVGQQQPRQATLNAGDSEMSMDMDMS